jgi:sulfofructose kinase
VDRKIKPALFVGGLVFDLTRDTDHWPGRNEKHTSNREVRCMGGGGTNSARSYRQLGLPCTLIAPLGLDGIGKDYRSELGNSGIQILPRDVYETPINIVRPKGMDRSLERGPEPIYVNPEEFPQEDPAKYCRLHLDGKERQAALYHARAFRAKGLDVSLDANPRLNTEELIEHSTIVFASHSYFATRGESFDDFFAFLRSKGVWFGGVTMGERGVVWFGPGISREDTDAPHVPHEQIEDTSGAGDGFHGALQASLETCGTSRSWKQHIFFASTVGAMMVRQFGNKHYPKLEEVQGSLVPRLAASA